MHIDWARKAKKNFEILKDQYPRNAEKWHYSIIDEFVEGNAKKIPDDVKECGTVNIV